MTYCDDCCHMRKPAKSAPPWNWFCGRHPRLEGFGWVTKTEWDEAVPFLKCVNVNGGACPLFEQKPDDFDDRILEATRKGQWTK